MWTIAGLQSEIFRHRRNKVSSSCLSHHEELYLMSVALLWFDIPLYPSLLIYRSFEVFSWCGLTMFPLCEEKYFQTSPQYSPTLVVRVHIKYSSRPKTSPVQVSLAGPRPLNGGRNTEINRFQGDQRIECWEMAPWWMVEKAIKAHFDCSWIILVVINQHMWKRKLSGSNNNRLLFNVKKTKDLLPRCITELNSAKLKSLDLRDTA